MMIDILDWGNKVYKLGQLKISLDSIINNKRIISVAEEAIKKDYSYILQGISYIINGGVARILKGNSSEGWKKGKLQFRMILEFVPDEPEITEYESPLDDIRREIQQNS